MSEEQQIGIGSDHSCFFWENSIVDPWMILNSDNSGGGSDEKINGKNPLIDSTSNSPTPNPTPTMTPPPPAGKKRRSRHGGLPKGGGKRTSGGSATTTNTTTTADGDGIGVGVLGVGESDHEIHIWTERERRKKMRNMFSGLHALLPQLPPKADKSTIVDEAISYIKNLEQSLKKLQQQKLEMLGGGGGGGGAKTASIDYNQQQPLAIVASSTISGFNSREAFLADQTAATGSAAPTTSRINNAMMITTNMINNASTSSSSTVPQCSFSIPGAPFNINPLAAASLQTWCSPNVVLCVNGEDAQISVSAPKKPGLFSTVCNVLEKHKLEVVSAHVSSDFYRSMYMIHAHATGAACEQFPELLSVEEIYKLAVGEIIFWLSC